MTAAKSVRELSRMYTEKKVNNKLRELTVLGIGSCFALF